MAHNPPAWFATRRAPPSRGRLWVPITSVRNQVWYSGRSSGTSTFSVRSGSKPKSSTSYSPVSRRRQKSTASASCRCHSEGTTGGGEPAGGSGDRTPDVVSPPTGSTLDSGDGADGGWADSAAAGGGSTACAAAALRRRVVSGRRGWLADPPGFDSDGTSRNTGASSTASDSWCRRCGQPECLQQKLLTAPRGIRRDHGPHRPPGHEGLKCFGGRVLRAVREVLMQLGHVHHPAEVQELQLLGGEVHAATTHEPAGELHAEGRYGNAEVPLPSDGLGEQQGPIAGDVEPAGPVRHGRHAQHFDRIVLVQQLQPGVIPQAGGDDSQGEIAGERRLDGRSDEFRETQHRHADIRTTPAEPANVAFDLDGILRVASTWQATCFGVLGEHRRIAGARAVYRGRRLHDQAAHRLRLLASGEQLHCPDDVEFLHRGASTRAARSRGD